jgi:hypothetical protein
MKRLRLFFNTFVEEEDNFWSVTPRIARATEPGEK